MNTKSEAWKRLMAAMQEDEAMKNAKPTGIEQLRHNLDLAPTEPLPFKSDDQQVVIIQQP